MTLATLRYDEQYVATEAWLDAPGHLVLMTMVQYAAVVACRGASSRGVTIPALTAAAVARMRVANFMLSTCCYSETKVEQRSPVLEVAACLLYANDIVSALPYGAAYLLHRVRTFEENMASP